MSAAAGKRKAAAPFIVDVSASLLRRNTELSKAARVLYSTMRSLADGKTGAVKIKNRWLKARAIDAAGEMCRCVRLRAMRELVAHGLVTMERERIERVIGGRKRVVLGACHYFVHRQPVPFASREKQPFLLKSPSSTVEEIDPQFISQHLGGPCHRKSGVDSETKSAKRDLSHHHRQIADDDCAPSLPTNEKPNRIAVLQDRAIDYLVGEGEDPETVAVAIEMIDERAARLGKTPKSEKYYIVCFENLKADDAELSLVTSEVGNRKARRDRYMPGFDKKKYSDKPDKVLTEFVRVAIERKSARAAT